MSDGVFTDSEEMDFSTGMSAFEGKNFSKAMQFLSPFAEKGNAQAQHLVAIMYQNGLGVGASSTEAVKWMSASA
ncbi:MAG: sel1 repeat family protein, partial [Cocleimonas sp.]|nr:sel1 repeat family protein [Cocleimonas sp.]